MKVLLCTVAFFAGFAAAAAPDEAVEKHVVVYKEKGRFGGWPANHGIWIWGNEILVGFSRGYYKDLGERHHIDREKPEEHRLARSLDGGETWTMEDPNAKGYLIPEGRALHGTELPGVKIPEAKPCPGGIDFTHPDFAMTLRMFDHEGGPGRFYYSYDRGKNWEGPFTLPDFGQRGIAPRTDYIALGPSECLMFSTASKSGGGEGRPFAARTVDGAKTWEFLGWICEEHEGYAIMPATVRFPDGGLLTAIRHRISDTSWIDAYYSGDGGRTWRLRSRPAPSTGIGNPADMIILQDGRVAIVYGRRAVPFGIYARLSADEGKTWGAEITLRDDGGSQDLGYCQTVQRPDGKIVTLYYFTDQQDPERYIAATIWDPAKVK